jgi:hypothetical protein
LPTQQRGSAVAFFFLFLVPAQIALGAQRVRESGLALPEVEQGLQMILASGIAHERLHE